MDCKVHTTIITDTVLSIYACFPFVYLFSFYLRPNHIQLDKKQQPESDQQEKKNIEVVNEEEQQDDNELKQMPHLPKQEQQPDGKPLESNVVKNDIQWGRRTLQTLLANLGLL